MHLWILWVLVFLSNWKENGFNLFLLAREETIIVSNHSLLIPDLLEVLEYERDSILDIPSDYIRVRNIGHELGIETFPGLTIISN
jgi:hypothetical protein